MFNLQKIDLCNVYIVYMYTYINVVCISACLLEKKEKERFVNVKRLSNRVKEFVGIEIFKILRQSILKKN